MNDYYSRDPLERAIVTKAPRLLRCDGTVTDSGGHQRQCNKVLAEVVGDAGGQGAHRVRCGRCGKSTDL